MPDVLVVGGGVIGLGVAWRLAERGHAVAVLEADPSGARPEAASRAAAGMLAPSAEVGFEEMDLYRLGRESLRRWPAFARALEAASGTDVGYRTEGTLVVAVDRDNAEVLRRQFRFQQSEGVPVSWLAPADALDLEPFLSPKIAGAVHAPEDHQVDNRAVVAALRAVLAAHPLAEVRVGAEVVAVEPHPERPAVRTASGERVEASVVVLAAGAWLRGIAGLPSPVPVRPVKGQMLALRTEPRSPSATSSAPPAPTSSRRPTAGSWSGRRARRWGSTCE
jgi:glycine oxidase